MHAHCEEASEMEKVVEFFKSLSLVAGTNDRVSDLCSSN